MDSAAMAAGNVRPQGAARRAGLAVAILAAGFALAACQPGTSPFGGGDKTETAPKPQKSTRIVDRDVEAPQVFQVTDQALWDGRPSLGGVWVASSKATDPERVIMRNPANGKFVIGALFRREVDNPGPSLQISSDAAEALGLLAGQPGKISVTALRREEAPETLPATPVLDTAEALPATPGAIDAGGVTTAALDAPKAGAKPAAKSPSETAAVAGAAIAAAPAPAPAAKPAAAPTKPAAEPPKATGGRPIQIGFFSVEANATRARDQLSKAGIAAEIRKEQSQGKDYWSVFARGDAALLKKIKAAGFADAYMLK